MLIRCSFFDSPLSIVSYNLCSFLFNSIKRFHSSYHWCGLKLERSFNATSMADFIEFPVYDGVSGDLWQWILWLEDFFIREKFTKLERLNLAQSLLAGQAEAWFYQNQKMLSSWKALRDWLWLEFGDSDDIDRFFQERVEQKKKRMETTSINLQESISNQQKLVEGSSENVAENWDEKASERKLISQFQVPVSPLEPGLSFSSESLDVSASWPCAFVSNNPVHSQFGFESVKNTTNAHQVLDKTSAHKDRLKQKSKRMLSLSPKTWMFKFKNKNLQRQYSCSRATFGSKGKEHNSKYGSRMRQTHISRLLCVYQTNAEKTLEALKEIQSQQATVRSDGTKVSSLPAKELVVPGDIVELRVGDKMPADMRVLALISSTLNSTPQDAKLYSLFSCELDTNENMSSGLSQTRQVWEPGGVLAAHLLVDWLVDFHDYAEIVEGIRCLVIGVCSGIQQPIEVDNFELCVGHDRDIMRLKLLLHSGFAGDKLTELDFHLRENHRQEKKTGLLVFPWNLLPLEFFWFIHLEDKVCLSGASNSWWGWLVFDRGKSNIISGDVITLVSSKELWMEILDGDIAKLLNSTCGKLQSYDYGLEITFLRKLRVHQQQQKRKFIKSRRFKYKSSLRNTRLCYRRC